PRGRSSTRGVWSIPPTRATPTAMPLPPAGRLCGCGRSCRRRCRRGGFPVTGNEVMETLAKSGALLQGHYLLTSGQHSDTYVEKFRLLERPDLAEPVVRALADRFRGEDVQVVLGPAVGGIIVAYEMARQLGARAVFAERQDGRLTLRRGFRIQPGERRSEEHTSEL